MYWWLLAPGLAQGLFALFAMYLPPLFPTLLRTTGAGFCYNIGRIAAATGVVVFGVFANVKDNMKIAQEEVFGPVKSIITFNNIDEEIARGNRMV